MVYSTVVTCTAQIGYILGASSGNTATVTAPSNGATVHLTGSPFTISSDHHFDFYRYDTFGSYSPTLGIQLLTTFPAASGYNSIENQSPIFDLPTQMGDCYRDWNLVHAESYSVTLVDPTKTTSITFVNEALSFYPVGAQIASGTASATATYP